MVLRSHIFRFFKKSLFKPQKAYRQVENKRASPCYERDASESWDPAK